MSPVSLASREPTDVTPSVPPRLEESGSFDDQVAEFKALFTPMPGPKAVNWHGENTLFVVLLGINDVVSSY